VAIYGREKILPQQLWQFLFLIKNCHRLGNNFSGEQVGEVLDGVWTISLDDLGWYINDYYNQSTKKMEKIT
jgi:hypothetical protein